MAEDLFLEQLPADTATDKLTRNDLLYVRRNGISRSAKADGEVFVPETDLADVNKVFKVDNTGNAVFGQNDWTEIYSSSGGLTGDTTFTVTQKWEDFATLWFRVEYPSGRSPIGIMIPRVAFVSFGIAQWIHFDPFKNFICKRTGSTTGRKEGADDVRLYNIYGQK